MDRQIVVLAYLGDTLIDETTFDVEATTPEELDREIETNEMNARDALISDLRFETFVEVVE